jgi:hypothetical protein
MKSSVLGRLEGITIMKNCNGNPTLKSKIDGGEVNHGELKCGVGGANQKEVGPALRQQRLSLVLRSARCKVVISQSGAGAT